MKGLRVEEKEIECRAEQGQKPFPYKEENGIGHFRCPEWNEQITGEGTIWITALPYQEAIKGIAPLTLGVRDIPFAT